MYKQYRPIEMNEFIVCAVDTSPGGHDYTAAQFLSKTRLDIPLVYHSKVTTSDFIPSLAATLCRIYDVTSLSPVVALERNNGGAFLMDRLAGINHENKFKPFVMPNYGTIENPDGKKYGWDTNTATRPKMLQDLKDAVDKRSIIIYDKETINELFSFVMVNTSSSWKAQAEVGAYDDLIMSLAIVWQLYQLCETPSPIYMGRQDFSKWRI